MHEEANQLETTQFDFQSHKSIDSHNSNAHVQRARGDFHNMASDVEGLSSDEDIVEQVYVYKTKNQYPDGAHESKKRAIRKKAKRFVVKDGELYYIQA